MIKLRVESGELRICCQLSVVCYQLPVICYLGSVIRKFQISAELSFVLAFGFWLSAFLVLGSRLSAFGFWLLLLLAFSFRLLLFLVHDSLKSHISNLTSHIMRLRIH